MAFVGLVLAVLALGLSTELSLANLGLSLLAALVWLLIRFQIFRFDSQVPRGSLSVWVALMALAWLSPLAGLDAAENRIVFGIAVAVLGVVFQGPVAVFFLSLLAALGVSAPALVSDLKRLRLTEISTLDSLWTFQVCMAFSVIVLFVRVSDTRRSRMQRALAQTASDTEKSRTRMATVIESLQLFRDRLLGRTLNEGDVVFAGIPEYGDTAKEPQGPAATFDDLMKSLRKTFADFQTRGRAEGRIAGPIRFVFLAPAGEHDERSTIGVDLLGLNSGLETCLKLSLDSLPEIGARKREGVIRLSVRYGLRVIEVAVEDNGRGLATRNEKVESDLAAFRERVGAWEGKFDRITRLGVGSRTSMELRILSEPAKSYRATLKHPKPIVSPVGDGSRA